MINQSSDYYVEIRVTDGKNLEKHLDQAVEKAIRKALVNSSCGVMVTRHDQQTFSVELTRDVPFGIISERDLEPAPPRPR